MQQSGGNDEEARSATQQGLQLRRNCFPRPAAAAAAAAAAASSRRRGRRLGLGPDSTRVVGVKFHCLSRLDSQKVCGGVCVSVGWVGWGGQRFFLCVFFVT
jgi:hypothetical protein